MKKNKPFAVIVIGYLLAAATGCFQTDGENSVSQEMLEPVKVMITGNIISAVSGEAVSGISVKIKRVAADDSEIYIQSESGDLETTSNAGGEFSFADRIEVDVQSYRYYLSLSDPDEDYFDNDSNVIYSVNDATLDFKNIKMMDRNPVSTTRVIGKVIDAIDPAINISNALIRIIPQEESLATLTTTTDSGGTFEFLNTPVSAYTLEIDAEDQNYVKESWDIILLNAPLNDLSSRYGSLRLVEQLEGSDLRIVLQWEDVINPESGTVIPMNLDSYFSLPQRKFDFNHLSTTTEDATIKIDPFIPVSYASGFGADTAYWPAFYGGRDNPDTLTSRNGRITIGTDLLPYDVNDLTIVQKNKNSMRGQPDPLDPFTASGPEIITVYNGNILESAPNHLAYYYEFETGSGIQKRFPVGVGVYYADCQTCSTDNTVSIYDTKAQVKIYRGNKKIGWFDIPNQSISPGESNRRYWHVLFVEFGSIGQNSSQYYFRVVPANSIDTAVTKKRYWYTNDFFTANIPADKGYEHVTIQALSSPRYINDITLIFTKGNVMDWAYGIYERKSPYSDYYNVSNFLTLHDNSGDSYPVTDTGTQINDVRYNKWEQTVYYSASDIDGDNSIKWTGPGGTFVVDSNSSLADGETVYTSKFIYNEFLNLYTMLYGTSAGLVTFRQDNDKSQLPAYGWWDTSHVRIGSSSGAVFTHEVYSIESHDVWDLGTFYMGTSDGLYRGDFDSGSDTYIVHKEAGDDAPDFPIKRVYDIRTSSCRSILCFPENSTAGNTHIYNCDHWDVPMTQFPPIDTVINDITQFEKTAYIATSKGIYYVDITGSYIYSIEKLMSFPDNIDVRGFFQFNGVLYCVTAQDGFLELR